MIDPSTLATSIQSQIANTVDEHIRVYVENIIRELSLDSAWISKIEQQINENISRRFGQKLSLLDINTLVEQSMDAAVDRYHQRHPAAPTGLADRAKQVELTLIDGRVQVEHDIITPLLTVDHDASISGTLTVQNIAIKGAINTDNKSWQQLITELSENTVRKIDQDWHQQLLKKVRDDITAQGIDFAHVTVQGVPLIEQGRLADNVTASNLQQLGNLERLNVDGQADIGGSLSVRPRRVGINTEHPDMALSIWDEETALMFGKHKEHTAYIGTSRPHKLVIGINRLPAIEIDENSKITVKNLTVGRHRICHEAEIPNYSGTKGDIVFNSNPRGDGVWGWQCLGAFKWQPLRST